MPFVPHTEDDISAMLQSIGAKSIEDLFDEIPVALQSEGLTQVPEGLSEMAVTRLMQERAEQDGRYLNFIGAGAYEHHIPAAVWQLVSRGEFYSAYTPYQAEASQGTLQVIYEYQSMITALTGMEVSNASLYDGATALGEAILMAVRAHKKARRVLVPRTVHPIYRKVAQVMVQNQNIELVEVDYDRASGIVDAASLPAGEYAALVIPQPNFFGRLEEVDALTDWAHANGALAIGIVNPLSLALLKPPGEWGAQGADIGADIAVGEGQPLGCPLSSGGPYYGFMTAKMALVRQMPGRIVGKTVDLEGKPGFALTLQAREQHIRRSKATSNICTNQGLLVTASVMHMSLLGPQGLQNVAASCHANTGELLKAVASVGAKPVFAGPVFHEAVIQLAKPAAEVLAALRQQKIVGGYDLARDYPELGNALLVCATETRTAEDIALYAKTLAAAM